jgi:hypothetical protein
MVNYHWYHRKGYEDPADSIIVKHCLINTILDITRILSPSTFEAEMSAYCARVLANNNFYVEVDKNGNVMARRGHGDTLPLLNAHMDTVLSHVPHTEDYVPEVKEILQELNQEWQRINNEKNKAFNIRRKERTLDTREARLESSDFDYQLSGIISRGRSAKGFPKIITLDVDKWRPEEINYYSKGDAIASSGVVRSKTGYKQQIGGDDKAGVGIILCIAQMTDLDFKVLLTVGEEPPYDGHFGVKSISPRFFDDVSYCISLDKREKDNLVTKISDVKLCKPQFAETIMHYGNFCGVKLRPQEGYSADAKTIAKYCQSVNMSAGYYNPHTDVDFIKIDEVLDLTCVTETCLQNIGMYQEYSKRGRYY